MDRDYVVERYRTRDGKVPFEEWVTKMKRKDPELAFRILLRIDRAEKGNFGDYRYLREGGWELKIDCGPGYRIYFSVQHRKILLLLIGGDKKSQKTDVKLAIDYWKDHQKDKPDEHDPTKIF
ncbi:MULTISPECIES: type II toxin-antitoxin system RelE/ParE family toxin [Enterobacter]|uniref:type II toxin-antitoxin system RelE/ParE family toxin n=1 Tax=Enterobacter TaxID=547 RepID=UPI0018885360|nr:type II toxin-antitoxin system RelE/ParE family toxin [Enterobacter sp. 61D5]MBF2789651.1 type II toxin-antitoxin system RelE/ParE family toxin [Enterobacter asburiae]